MDGGHMSPSEVAEPEHRFYRVVKSCMTLLLLLVLLVNAIIVLVRTLMYAGHSAKAI